LSGILAKGSRGHLPFHPERAGKMADAIETQVERNFFDRVFCRRQQIRCLP
jgi:hypothetical protein